MSSREGASGSLLRLIVKTIQNETHTVEVEASSTIQALKSVLVSSTSVAEDRQRLIYRGKVLVDENKIQDYQIQDGHILHMIAKPANYAELKRSVETPSTPAVAAPQTHDFARSPTMPRAQPVASMFGQASQASTRAATTAAAASSQLGTPNDTIESLEGIRQAMLTMRTLLSTMDRGNDTTESKSSSEPLERQFFPGQWLDVKDTVAQWLEATVLAVDRRLKQVYIHYNGWPARWDEWIPFDSPRIAPFRSRTVHAVALAACPTPNVTAAHAPATGVNDARTLLPELARTLQLLTPWVTELARSAEQSLSHSPPALNNAAAVYGVPWSELLAGLRGPSTQYEGAHARLQSSARDMCPLMDRLGRILTDFSPLLWDIAEPGARAAQQASVQRQLDSFQSLEARLISLLSERPPSPPPIRSFRRPVNAQVRASPDPFRTAILDSALGGRLPMTAARLSGPTSMFGPMPRSGGAGQHLDVHVAFLSPSVRPAADTPTALSQAMTSLSDSLAARTQELVQRTAAISELSSALNQVLQNNRESSNSNSNPSTNVLGSDAASAETSAASLSAATPPPTFDVAVAAAAEIQPLLDRSVGSAALRNETENSATELDLLDDDGGEEGEQLDDLLPPQHDDSDRDTLMPFNFGDGEDPASSFWNLSAPSEQRENGGELSDEPQSASEATAGFQETPRTADTTENVEERSNRRPAATRSILQRLRRSFFRP